jgi:hypothetical protein
MVTLILWGLTQFLVLEPVDLLQHQLRAEVHNGLSPTSRTMTLSHRWEGKMQVSSRWWLGL